METTIVRLIKIFKSSRFRIGFFIIYIGVAMGLILFTLYYSSSFRDTLYKMPSFIMIIGIIAALMVLTGIGYTIFGYLEGDKKTDDNINPNINREFKILRNEILELLEKRLMSSEIQTSRSLDVLVSEIRKELLEKNKIRIDLNQDEQINQLIKESIKNSFNESFINELKEQVSFSFSRDRQLKEEKIFIYFEVIQSRLKSQIQKLNRRANLNLSIGSATTILSLIALGYIVFQHTVEMNDLPKILNHYIPRISLIVFVEIFAFFFLRLYKTNLNDIKYYQNELTTIELKVSSINTAINYGNEGDLTTIINELARSERNLTLKSGETTIDLEKNKIEKGYFKDALDFTSSVLNKQK